MVAGLKKTSEDEDVERGTVAGERGGVRSGA
jgi:hypothetical protein